MTKSAVAGILNPSGALRVVVTQRWRMSAHLKKGERLFVVPGLLVEEPLPFNSALMVRCITEVQRHVAKILAPVNRCGRCRQCCITPYISSPEWNDGHGFEKPSHAVCRYCDESTGCLTQHNKPGACRRFECLAITWENTNHPLPEEMKPDRCGVILTGPEEGDPEDIIYLHPNIRDPEAHNREPVLGWIERIEEMGYRVRFVTHYHGKRNG